MLENKKIVLCEDKVVEGLSKKLKSYGLDTTEKDLRLLLGTMDSLGITKSIGDNLDWVLQFIMLCTTYKKNPLKRDIYAVRYGNNFSVIINYLEYIKPLESNPNYAGYTCKVVMGVENERGEITEFWPKDKWYAIFTCKPKNWDKEYRAIFLMSEWNKGIAEWVNKPAFMLEKTAIKNGLVKCFPNVLGDLIKLEEAPLVQNEETPQEKKQSLKGVFANE